MARTFDDLLANLDKLEKALEAELPKIATEYAQNGTALIIQHIQKEGIEGKSYSTNPMLVTQSSFLQKSKSKFKPDVLATTLGRNSEGKLVKGGVRTKKGTISRRAAGQRYRWIKFKRASKAVPVMTLPGGYKMLRSIQGLQTSYVDLTYSGRMLQNTKILSTVRKSKWVVYSIVGGVNEETKKKLQGNYKRYGDFMRITPKIAEVINQVPQNRVASLIKQYLG